MPKRSWLLACCAGLAGIALFGASSAAGAAPAPAVHAAPADDVPPPIVEDHIHPAADRILAEQGVKLTNGDGNIFLVPCPAALSEAQMLADDLIRVRRNLQPMLCFRETGTYIGSELNMDIPGVTFVKAADRVLRVTFAEQDTPMNITKGEWTPIPGDKGSTLRKMMTTT
ncbi:hypothetical protein [Amycolatopsis samaneae]|uniref:Secreted protein n=1 Tax=Amycolatopsis samaneae TaxID=664691 RepID=A0ABW5GNK3_9PSEU